MSGQSNKYLFSFTRYRNLLRELVKRDIKIRYRRSVLGIIWSVLNPLLLMMVMNAVFSTLFRFQIENYIIYLLTGQILFNFLLEATSRSMTSILENASLIKKVYIPKSIFPFSRVLSAMTNLGFSLGAVFIMMILTGVSFTWNLFLVPLLLLYVFIFSLGMGLIFASYTVFFRDLLHIHGVLMTAWMYLTPIFYPASIIPAQYSFILNGNPMYYFLQYFRMIIMEGRVPGLELNLICLGMSVLSWAAGYWAFYRKQNHFILYI